MNRAGSDIVLEKKALRKEFLAARSAISPLERLVLDGAVSGHILSLSEFAAAPGVILYASDGTEPELRGVCESALAAGKIAALPRFVPDSGVYELARITDWERDLAPGRYGLLEPARSLPAVSGARDWVWLIPGVAFDAHGTRLGRGKGFYDRLLNGHPGIRIGVFYQCQFSDRALPKAEHDGRLAWAVTEIKIYKF